VRRGVALSLAAALALWAPATAPAEEAFAGFSADDLVERVEKVMRGDTARYRAAMTVVTPRWTRTIEFRSWDDRHSDRSLTRILAPAKDRGTGFLKVEQTLWTYLPRVERTTRMPPSMLLQPWMGSDFTNDDLVRESSLTEDYVPRLIGEREIEGAPAIGVLLEPRPEAPVVWGRVDVWVERERLAPLLFVYYEEAGGGKLEEIRRMRMSDVRVVQGRPLPHRWEMIPLHKSGHRTIVEMSEVEFDLPIDEETFTLVNLKRAEAVR
jgi:outer membrane lipoprotein-sorting protein